MNHKEVKKVEVSLRGLVLSKYKTVTAFANAIGWERGKASRIVNGSQEPGKKDMEQIIALLEIEKSAVAPIFFGSMFTE